MFWWMVAASAQDLTVFDFDTTVPESIFAWSGSASIGAPVVPWSGDALRIEMYPGYSFPDVEAYVEIASEGDGNFVITHDTLHLVARTDAIWSITVLPVVYASEVEGVEYGGENIEGTWTAVTTPNLGYMCGHPAGVEIWTTGWWSSVGNNQVDVDDVQMTGSVCAVFSDTDGDGLCPQGTDLDADGVCVTEPERLPFGETADCDDLAFGPTCLTVAASPLVPGGAVTFTTSGAAPGETVRIAGSSVPGTRCPPALGGACLGFDRPKYLGSAVADGAGVAVVVVDVPPAIGSPLWAQAVVLRPGEVADLSGVIDVGP